MRLYTAGYEKRSLDEYIGLVKRAGNVVVVDVRETAWSHKPGFSKTALQAGLVDAGLRYVHARYAGNPKALRVAAPGPVECLEAFDRHVRATPRIVQQLDELLLELDADGQSACFLCYERHPDDCHRGVLARHLAAGRSGLEVVHLGPDGGKRLTVRTTRSVPRSSGTTGQLSRTW